MADWVKRLDAFLQFNEEDILHDKGKVTAAIAKAIAEKEFEKFRVSLIYDRTLLAGREGRGVTYGRAEVTGE